jgi:hypothetical protein
VTKQGVEEAVRKAQELIEAHKATQSMSHPIRAVSDAMAHMGLINTYIAEMRLILPQKVFKKAELPGGLV